MAAGADDGLPLRVTVQNLATDTLELDVSSSDTVLALKALVQEAWEYPPVVQQLLLGADILDNASTLAEHCGNDSTLHLTMLYSPPYDGDVHKASLAKDREAVRVLMRFRDEAWQQDVNGWFEDW